MSRPRPAHKLAAFLIGCMGFSIGFGFGYPYYYGYYRPYYGYGYNSYYPPYECRSAERIGLRRPKSFC